MAEQNSTYADVAFGTAISNEDSVKYTIKMIRKVFGNRGGFKDYYEVRRPMKAFLEIGLGRMIIPPDFTERFSCEECMLRVLDDLIKRAEIGIQSYIDEQSISNDGVITFRIQKMRGSTVQLLMINFVLVVDRSSVFSQKNTTKQDVANQLLYLLYFSIFVFICAFVMRVCNIV